MKRHELDESGNFVCDILEDQVCENWTRTVAPDGLINGRLVGAVKSPDGEWVGGEWVGDDLPAITREQVELARLIACADPVHGSDRFLAEALRREDAGDIEGGRAARLACRARYEEIKLANPWPESE